MMSVNLPKKEFYELVQVLFLDWDGTIRRSKKDPKGFIEGPEDIELIPGIEEKINEYVEQGHLIIGISNQGGVAWGYKTVETIIAERDATFALFKRNPFNIVKFSFFMENGKVEPWRHKSLLRKPNYGMIAHAEVECFEAGYVIDYDNSLFVGDSPEDHECARNAGIPFLHIDAFLQF